TATAAPGLCTRWGCRAGSSCLPGATTSGSTTPAKSSRLDPSGPQYWVALAAAGPPLQLRPLPAQALGQFLDAQPFRRVVPGQQQGQAVSTGGEVIVEAHLAGQQYVGMGAEGVAHPRAPSPRH